MIRRPTMRAAAAAIVLLAAVWTTSGRPAAQSAPKTTPDTPFKLMTFETGGSTRVGMVLGTRVLDIGGANRHVSERAKLPAVAIPTEMKALIEQYAAVAPRLYQIANFFAAQPPASLPFAFDVTAVSVKAPIKYPWNLMAASANYKAHAEGMGATGAYAPPPPRRRRRHRRRPHRRPRVRRPPAPSMPPPPTASSPTATRRSCSPSRRAPASSTPTSRSTSSTAAAAPTTRASWRSSWGRARPIASRASGRWTTSSATASCRTSATAAASGCAR